MIREKSTAHVFCLLCRRVIPPGIRYVRVDGCFRHEECHEREHATGATTSQASTPASASRKAQSLARPAARDPRDVQLELKGVA